MRAAAEPGGLSGMGDRADPGLDPLYREMRRIREIAESREAADRGRGVAELTREVAELRATVARLRGSAMAGVPANPAS